MSFLESEKSHSAERHKSDSFFSLARSESLEDIVIAGTLFITCATSYVLTLESMSYFYEETFRSRFVNSVSTFINSLAFPCLLLLHAYQRRRPVFAYLAVLICFGAWAISSVYYRHFESPISLSIASRLRVLPEIANDILTNRISWREGIIVVSMMITCCMYAAARRSSQNMTFEPRLNRPVGPYFFCVALLAVILTKGVIFNARYPPWKYTPSYAVKSLKRNGFIAFYGCQFVSLFNARPPLTVFPGKVIPLGGHSGADSLPTKKPAWNVIFMQVESLDARVLDVKVGDKYLLPNLQWLKESSVFCNNFFAHHRAGGSQDSELGALFSLIPSNTRPGLNNLRLSDAESLSDVLARMGYYRGFFHSNDGDFFDRRWAYKTVGFDLFVDSAGFSGDAKGWYAKDLPFFEQSWSMIEALPKPFFAYLVTMQSHSPYQNFTDRSEGVDLSGHANADHGYLRSLFEVDEAIGRFFELLRKSPLGDNTLVFVYGDHWSAQEYAAPDYLYSDIVPVEHVPLFVYAPGLAARQIHRVCSQIDLAPTVCELLGIPEGKGWLGSSIFQGESGKVILNYPMPLVIENSGEKIKIRNAQPDEMKFVDFSEAMQDD